MALYKTYPAHIIFARRAFAVAAGVLALPVMLLWKDRARFYSVPTDCLIIMPPVYPAVFFCHEWLTLIHSPKVNPAGGLNISRTYQFS